jgi:capsular polysaccharide export protein
VNLDCVDEAALHSTFVEPAHSGEPKRATHPAGKRTFLIVSAPFGPFGRQLAAVLRARGARVLRVILNGGDALDWGRREALPYRGALAGWCAWLERQIREQAVTDVVTHGDSSPHAAAALQLALGLGLGAQVLEQGYFRPDWVTVERGGVNANSRLPAEPDWYLAHRESACGEAVKVGRTTPSAVAHIVAYHLAVYAATPWFPRFRPHYSEPAHRQAIGHVARYCWQQASLGPRRRALEALTASGAPLFLCLLQRPGDSQLLRHSDFMSTSAFIEQVVTSFAAHAPPDARLIVRPHPFDPGLTRHAAVLSRLARQAGVESRVGFVDYGKLHEVLPHVRGVVCVNSTAGLAAIEFGKPTVTLGRAIYDMPGMTHQGGLDLFWMALQAPDPELYAAFRRAVLAETQVNGAYATARGRRLAVSGVAERLLAPAHLCSALNARREWRYAPTRSDPPIVVQGVREAVSN